MVRSIFLNVTWVVTSSFDFARDDKAVDHVVAVEWVAVEEVAERIAVGVVREPLVAHLNGTLVQRYVGFHDAGITIEWPRDSS